MMSNRWYDFYLNLALVNATMSKDPDTQVGAVVVGPDGEVRAQGFNGFPRGIHDDWFRLNEHMVKNTFMVHAEMNCFMNAARIGVSMRNCTLYLAATDKTGLIWGGPPCISCTLHAIQAGITYIVSPPQKKVTRWQANLDQARILLKEAGVHLTEYDKLVPKLM